MSVPHAQRLNFGGVLGVFGWQSDSAGHNHSGQIVHRRESQHHRRQTLVAGRDADDSFTSRHRPNQPPQHHGRIVAIRQAVHHAGRPLRSPVARIADERRERQFFQPIQFLGRRLHEQPDLPMPGVIAQRDRLAVLAAHSALRTQDQILRPTKLRRIPTHAGGLRQSEHDAAGLIE